MAGRVLSVNLAEVRTQERRGRQVRTGIWKLPTDARVRVHAEGVEGDSVFSPGVHGGVHKAVYAYAREDIDWWQDELGRPLENGIFGENLTLTGVEVTGALIGERWEVGAALLEVSEPRFPCWKLAGKMEDPRFVKRFARAGRLGAYLRVLREGELGAGDEVRVVERPGHGVTIGVFGEIYLHDHARASLLLGVPQISDDYRDWAGARAAA